jgi:hypothetical protein
LFALWFLQMVLSPAQGATGMLGTLAHNVNWGVTIAYFVWAAGALAGYVLKPSRALAFAQFAHVWKEHVRKGH